MFLSRKVVKVIDWVAVGVFASAAVVVTVLRLSLPSLDQHKDTILPYLNNQLGIELNVEHIHATWREFGPVLVAKGVSIQEEEHHQIANIESMEFQFNFWDSLWQGNVFFKKIRISGAKLDLTSTKREQSSSELNMDEVESYVSELFGTQQGYFELSDICLQLDAPEKNEILKVFIDHLTWRNVDTSTHNLAGQIHLNVDENILRLKGNVLVYLSEGQDWGVDAISAAFQSGDREWTPFSVKYLRRGYLNTLNIDHLLLQDFHPIIHSVIEPQGDSGPLDELVQGEVHDVRVSWGRELESPQFSFDIKDIKTERYENIPSLDHLSLSVIGSQNAGVIKANIADNMLLSSALFTTDFDVAPAEFDIAWYQKKDGFTLWSERLALSVSHVDLDARLFVDIPKDGSAFISAYSTLALDDMTHLIDYFPEDSVGEGAHDFIRDAFGSGHSETGRVLWFGDLTSFPFDSKDGVFQVDADLKDVELTFEKHWPKIDKLDANFQMRNQDILIASNSAKSMGVTGKQLKAKIPHVLSTTWLELSGDLQVGSGKEAQRYLINSPLKDSVAPALDAVQIQGPVAVNLNLNIPFSADDDNYQAWGHVDLDNNPVHINVPSLDLSKTKGRLYFNNEKISIKKLSANLYKQPIKLTLQGDQKKKNYRIDMDIKGNWDIKTLNHSLDLNALNYVTGTSWWNLGVGLDITKDDVLFSVKGSANADRLKSQLPYPLDRLTTDQTGKVQPINVALRGNGKAFRMDVRSPKISYSSRYTANNSELDITSSVFTLGYKVKAKPQRRGHHTIHVATDSADGDTWLPIVFDIIEAKPKKNDSVQGLPVGTPELIQLDIDNLKLGGLHWYESVIDAWRKRDFWSLDVTSHEAVGKVEIYDNRPWLAHFKKLFIFYPGEEGKPESKSSFPRVDTAIATEFDRDLYKLMPDFVLKADDFWFQGYSLGKVAATLSRIGKFITWKDVTLKAGSIEAKTHGKWTIKNGKNHTQEYLTLKAKNNSEILDRLGIDGGIRGSSVDMAMEMKWDGTLWGVKADTLEGNISLNMGEGVVKNISGATNFVGLLSLDSLLKRIRLDFSGIFEEGLAVESLVGHASMKDGILTTTDSKMSTVPGDMKISGNMDFIREELDLKVNFIPDFASGVPVIAAFAISPPVGVIAFAVSKLFSPVIDVVTEINYAVTGSFYSPQVQELSRNSGEIEVPQSQEEE